MFSSPLPISSTSIPVTGASLSPIQKPGARVKLSCCRNGDGNESSNNGERGFSFYQRQTGQNPTQPLVLQRSGLCNCGRRHLLGTIGSTVLCPSLSALGSEHESLPNSSYTEMLKRIRPPRADWYEEFYASVMNNFTKSYEAEIASYKSQLFSKLMGEAKEVLEIGIGTGPNLKYYVTDASMHVFGIDPNKKMEKYARAAAEAAGLLPENFEFVQAVGECLPLGDASVDAVIGTLVLCSVRDVDWTLKEVKRVLRPGGLYLFVEHVAAKEGTPLRFVQNILDPLQQLLGDGCHLTRETGRYIAEAGFSGVDSSMTRISNASFVNPHLYGTARK